MTYKHTIGAVALGLTLLLTGCSGDGSSSAQDFNDADVTFAQDMIPHHQQAVEMTELASTRADSQQVKDLAAEIEGAQDPEIETMTGWLQDWGQDVPQDMGDMDVSMPGMMSSSEMADLADLSGPAFDSSFLSMMIEHHTGAIEMAKAEQTDGENADAIALAEQIETSQAKEVTIMKKLLASQAVAADPLQFADVLQTGDPFVLNVHVPFEGSIDGTEAFVRFDRLAERAEQLPGDRSTTVAVYCKSGRMSRIAASTLAELGYQDVIELDGGMDAWRDAGLPITQNR